MNQFFIQENQIVDGKIRIEGADAIHIRSVLRMKRGGKLRACIPDGKAYLCEIETVDEAAVTVRILDLDGTFAELPGEILLFQGLPKGDKMELVIQKAVELGVMSVIPTAMTNCVVKLTGEKAAKKNRRWQAIAQAAAEQSKRGIIPKVTEVMPLAKAAALAQSCGIVLVPYEMADADDMTSTEKALHAVQSGMRVGVFIGPEGGFDKKEIALLQEMLGEKLRIISLGHRILRTETAGLTTLSLLMYHFEVAAAKERQEGTGT